MKQLLLLPVKAGSGACVGGMGFANYLSKVKNCLLTVMQLMILLYPSVSLLKKKIYSMNEIFNCDETGLNFTCYLKKHSRDLFKNQLMAGKKHSESLFQYKFPRAHKGIRSI